MKTFRIQFLVLLGMVGVCAALTVYSFRRCGWGMFAYENAVIAALTGECAQQQRLMPPVALPPTTELPAPTAP